MKIISVSTNIWKSPVGWWKAVPGKVKECDYVASLPMKGQVNSLNASVAAGILIYNVLDKRK